MEPLMNTRHHRPADRRGFALAVALFALVVIGALIAGVFFASTQEYRVGRNTLTQQRAFSMAEYGLNQTMNGWNSNRYRALATAGIDSASSYTVDGATAKVKVTRLNSMAFWVMSEGSVGSGAMNEAKRRTSAVVRLEIPNMNFLGALTLRGNARIGGSSQISGTNYNPSTWTDCPPVSGGMPGLVVDSLNHVNYTGNDYSISGSPTGVVADPRARDTTTYFNYGDTDWNELVSSATLRLPAGSNFSQVEPDSIVQVVNGVTTKRCNTSLADNWGQVTRTGSSVTAAGICETYFPIIYVAGDLGLSGGTGQGVLLVEGDLTVQGGFSFYGPVIVRGTLRTSGTGGHFYGGVMAANVQLDASVVLGDAEVRYSSCTITQALMGSATPAFIKQRSWAELY